MAVLDLEWVMRGFYEIESEPFCQVLAHLLGIPYVIFIWPGK